MLTANLLWRVRRPACALALLAVLMPLATRGFPPAPNHLMFGTVRDELGNPLVVNTAVIILESASGTNLTSTVVPELGPGINYTLEVPMDAGLTDDLYKPTALLPAAPFLLHVQIGNTNYLPMEMTANLSRLGQPGGRTRVDLTLGVDANGNGLPDAWEAAVAKLLGLNKPIRPGDLYPGTGMTFRDVYIAGTYTLSPKDGFTLAILNGSADVPRLTFTAVAGRTYTVQGTSKVGEQWTAIPFRVLPADTNASTVTFYQSTQTQRIEIEAPSASDSGSKFFRLMVE